MQTAKLLKDDELQHYVDNMEYKLKEQHSKNATILFIIFGIIIFLWENEPIFSVGFFVFLFAGMFLASFLSIPSYLLKMQLAKRITVKQTYVIRNFYWALETAYTFFVTYFLFYIYTLLF